MLEAIVFDFDGLILDTESSVFAATEEIFAEHGVDLDRVWWATIVGTAEHRDWVDVLEELVGEGIDRDAVRAARNARHHAQVEVAAIRPGVVELLDEVVAGRVPVGVASSSSREWVAGQLERVGLLDRFATVRTRDDVAPGRTKPAPDLYAAAIDALAAAPSRSVAIEDSPHGVAAARSAGLRVVAVPGPMTADLDFSGADRVVPSMLDLSLSDIAALASRG